MGASKWLNALSLFAVGYLLFACARPFNPDIERGSGYQFKHGYPEARLSAIGFIDEDRTPYIDLAVEIVYGSLIFKKSQNLFRSDLSMEIQIMDKDRDNHIVRTSRHSITIEEEKYKVTQSQEEITFEKRINVDPGNYKVVLSLTDLNSEKETVLTTNTIIHNPDKRIWGLTNIQMLSKINDSGKGWVPNTTYDVPGKVDSLKFIFQITNNSPDPPLKVNSQLIKYRSDTTISRPIHYNNYNVSHIAWNGINYDEKTIIQSSQRIISQAGNSILIEFKFAQQIKGNYRFQVETEKEQGNTSFKARDFGIKSTNYPTLKTPRELAGPLVYLMDEDEHEELMAIKNSRKLKQAVDRFWLKEIGNKSRAKSTLELYYQRVEEANKKFSNFKEGWKTDMGRMYILFGPPWFVDYEEHDNIMEWSYSYDRYDPKYNFDFSRTRKKSEYFPFDNYLLIRSQSYFTMNYNQINLWLSGYIFTDSNI